MAQKATYDKTTQQNIISEADAAVQKTLSAIARKYPGVTIGHQIAVTFPSQPIIVSHSGNTRPLTARDTHALPPEALGS